jgi:hypothetical protein
MRRLIALACLTWPLLAAAQAQSPIRLPVDPNDSIRAVMRNGTRLEGRFLRQVGDSVMVRVVSSGGATDTALAAAELSTLEVRVRHHAVFKGFGIGVLTGVAVGGALAGASMNGCTGDMCGMAIIAVPITAALGGLVGLVAGGIHSTDGWELVWRPIPVRP